MALAHTIVYLLEGDHTASMPQEDSDVVGGGARDLLLATSQAKTSNVTDILSSLHDFLKPQMEEEPLKKYMKKTLPGGQWLKRHTQHVCCELRKWKTRLQKGKRRNRNLEGVAERARVRALRLRQVYRSLGFKSMPAVAKKQVI